MKLMELRIGNLINNKEENIVYVNPNHLIVLAYGIENVFKPIPLTEEWLLKFGFEKSKSKFYYLNEFGVSLDFTAFIFKSCLWNSENVQYVHQLQNVHFALTSEELIINK
jgi:hypothetical protein